MKIEELMLDETFEEDWIRIELKIDEEFAREIELLLLVLMFEELDRLREVEEFEVRRDETDEILEESEELRLLDGGMIEVEAEEELLEEGGFREEELLPPPVSPPVVLPSEDFDSLVLMPLEEEEFVQINALPHPMSPMAYSQIPALQEGVVQDFIQFPVPLMEHMEHSVVPQSVESVQTMEEFVVREEMKGVEGGGRVEEVESDEEGVPLLSLLPEELGDAGESEEEEELLLEEALPPVEPPSVPSLKELSLEDGGVREEVLPPPVSPPVVPPEEGGTMLNEESSEELLFDELSLLEFSSLLESSDDDSLGLLSLFSSEELGDAGESEEEEGLSLEEGSPPKEPPSVPSLEESALEDGGLSEVEELLLEVLEVILQAFKQLILPVATPQTPVLTLHDGDVQI